MQNGKTEKKNRALLFDFLSRSALHAAGKKESMCETLSADDNG
jgi:hypothetical protein